MQLGACEEDQTAVTSRKLPGVVGTYTGAATHAFVTAIKEHGVHQSYASLLQHMTEALAALGKVSDEGLPEVLADEAAAAADDADGAADASKASDAVDAGSTVAGVLAGELQRAAGAGTIQHTAVAGDSGHRPCDQAKSSDAGPDVAGAAAAATAGAADRQSCEAAKAVFKHQQPGARSAEGMPSTEDASATADQATAAAAAATIASGPAVESRFDSFGARGPLHDLLGLLTGREATQHAGEQARQRVWRCFGRRQVLAQPSRFTVICVLPGTKGLLHHSSKFYDHLAAT